MQNYENDQVNTVDELPWEIDGLKYMSCLAPTFSYPCELM